MLYHNVRVAGHLLRFIDAGAIAAVSLGAWEVGRQTGAWPASTLQAMLFLVAVDVFAFLALATRLRIYHPRRTEDVALELFVLCEIALYAMGLSCLATQIFTAGLPANTYLAITGASLLMLLALRVAMRVFIRRLRRRGDDYRVWLIIGHNDRSADLAEEIVGNPHFGIKIAEVVDISTRSGAGSHRCRRFGRGVLKGIKPRVLGSVEDVRQIVATRVIDEVAVMLPVRSHYDTISRILEICSGPGISVRIRPQAFDTGGYSTDVSWVGDIPMLTHYNGPSNYRQLVAKRVLDVVGAGAGLLLLMPLLLAIAVAIKVNSPGPVLFRQTRVGLHGRHFEVIKFRSMVKDALQQRAQLTALNERDGRAFKIRNDARVTRVGRWLRKYRLDELPQLWNVLVGDMSLVGPRPFPVNEAHGFEWWQRRRHTMPPGLTCLWQIEDDPRMPLSQWMELDMAYIDRWSIWLDLKLIVRTLFTIVRGNGW